MMFFSKPLFSQDNTIESLLTKVSVGLSGGLNFPNMHYSDPNLADYKSLLLIRGTFGGYVEIDLTNHFSIRPELTFIGRGQKIEDTGINYSFLSKYFDFHLPIIYNFQTENINPYLMLAPSIGFARGGQIKLNDYSKDITTASIAPVDLGVMMGGGIKKHFSISGIDLIAGIELAYNLGLTNTYSKLEKNSTADAVNMGLYSIEGTRKNRGLSITASFGFPLGKLKEYINKSKTKNIDDKASKSEVKISPERICYTIEEINQMIEAEEEVNNKVICMENLNFEFNKSILDKSSSNYLDIVVTLLKKVPSIKMEISGHTDNKGTDEYNLDLSKQRAEAVCNYLISQGISKERLSYKYYGASRPLVPNDSETNRYKNRRVEFAISKK
jgi:outer membrane protein OmpA-like peptidoglycan-associated protein